MVDVLNKLLKKNQIQKKFNINYNQLVDKF